MTSRSEVEIRPFRRRDLARVREIEDASFPRDPYPNEFFLDLFENCGRLFFIAKHSGRIAGYVVTCTGKRDAEIVSIAVDPLHRIWPAQGKATAALSAGGRRGALPSPTQPA